MDWGSPGFVIAIIAISTVGWIVNNWIRAKHGYELEDEWGGKSPKASPDEKRKIELLSNENAQLVGKIERIATDPAKRTAEEIEALREKN